MASWKKKEVDAAKIRQGKRGNEAGKVVIVHGSVEFCKATPIDLVEGILVRTRDGPSPT